MHKPDLIYTNNSINNYNDHNISVHPTDISLDNNNNETPEHTFGTGKRYDSGLGILSPQSDDSIGNLFPNIYHDKVDNSYSSINIQDVFKTSISPKKKWCSLGTKDEDKTNELEESSNGIIELKTLDSNNNMATSIVIYRNDNRQFRHINIIDYRPKYKSKVRRSNTFSNDKNNKNKESPQRYMCRSTDNLTFAQNSLSQSSSFSDHTSQIPNQDQYTPKSTPKSSSKIIQKLISTFCCRKNVPSNSEISDEEMPTFDNYPDWKFSLDEFDNITYFSSGAQGTIYTAILKDAKVALKKVKENTKKDDIHIEHLMALNHKNIITFIGICEEAPNYLVMEFCSQGQLFDWIHRELQIAPQDISSWAFQICDGMAYLHNNDIIHRDLKSPNVLITENHILKIIDFEFSKDCCESKKLNSFVGTMAWMAPEVLREEVHTKKVDVWSYGVVIWEMITREIPYCGIERFSILFGVGNNCLKLPLCSTMPLEIKNLLSNCLEPCADKRPSFQHILNNISNYLHELEHYTLEEFTSKQKEWKSEIECHFKEMNKEKVSTTKIEAELVRRRTNELSDAKNIKELYNEKLRRADKLIALLNKCLNAVEDERKKNDCEWKLIQRFKQSIYPGSTSKDDQGTFLSLQVNNKVKNRKMSHEKISKAASPNNNFKKERSTNRHSMLEQCKTAEKIHRVRRKHSVPIFRERNYVPGIKIKPVLDKNLTKTRSKKTSLSLETVTNDVHNSNSLNVEVLNKKTENRWKRNSSPCRKLGFSTLPSPNKTSLRVEDFSGTINPSFEGSCDSFTTLRELKMTNSNLLQIAYLGNSASIYDINASHENLSDSLNTGPSYPLFHHSLLEESITECLHTEETSKMKEINEDIHECGNSEVVVIREMSGRSKPSITRNSQFQSDSLDVSMLNLDSQTPYSLIEKENIAQGLIKPFGFLAHMNEDIPHDENTTYSNHERVTKDLSESL